MDPINSILFATAKITSSSHLRQGVQRGTIRGSTRDFYLRAVNIFDEGALTSGTKE